MSLTTKHTLHQCLNEEVMTLLYFHQSFHNAYNLNQISFDNY